MPRFSPKSTQIDWPALGAIDIDSLAETGDDAQFENLYSTLVSAETPSASEVFSHDLVRLFQITQLVMENRNLYLEEAEAKIETMERTFATQGAEIARLKKQAGGNVDAEDIGCLQQTALEHEAQFEKLQLEMSELEALLQSERITVQDLKSQLQLANERAADAEVRAESSVADARELREQLALVREKAISNRNKEELARAGAREKSQDTERYLQKIRALSEENAQLAQEMESVTVELEAAMTEIENNQKQQNKFQEILLENDRAIEESAAERDRLLLRVQELAEKAEIQRIRDEDRIRKLQNELDHFEANTSDIRREASEKEQIIRRLEEELNVANEELDTYNVDAFKKTLRERDELIQTLRAKLEESFHDFELLSADWDKVDALIKDKEKEESVTAALKERLASASKIAEKFTTYQKLHEEDFRRIYALEDLVRTREAELVDVKTRLADMQNGVYGLSQALAENKELVIQKGIRDKNILSLTSQVNELQRALDECMEENEVMRERLGIANQAPIDTYKVKHQMKLQLDQLRSENDARRKELDVAERECSTLRSQLRLKTSELESRAYGSKLPAEELPAVESSCQRREGTEDADVMSFQSNRNFASLVNLEESQARATGQEQLPIDKDHVERLLSEMENLHADLRKKDSARQEVEESFRALSMENERLQGVVNEIGRALINMWSSKEVDSNDAAYPSVESILESLKKLKEHMTPAAGLQTTSEDLLEMNRVLREENEAISADVKMQILLVGEKDRTIEQLRQELDVAKLRQSKSPERIIRFPENLAIGGTRFDVENMLEQLAECLRDLEERNTQINRLQGVLAQHEEAATTYVRQQHMLYREYQQAQTDWQQEKAQLETQQQGLKQINEMQGTRIEALEVLLKDLELSPDDMARRLTELSRKVVVLTVNERSLTRKEIVSTETEKDLWRQNEKLRSDMVTMEKAAQEVIRRLHLSVKREASHVELLQRRLHGSVRAESAAETSAQLEKTTFRLKEAIVKLAELASKIDADAQLEGQLKSAQDEIQTLRFHHEENKSKISWLRKAFADLTTARPQKSPAEMAERLATLEARLENANRKIELAEGKAAAARRAENDIRRMLDEYEKKHDGYMKEMLILKESEIDARHSLEGCLRGKEWEEQLAIMDSMRQTIASLQHDVQKQKDMADMAARQLADIMSLQEDQSTELQILRSALKEFASASDEQMMVAQLHQELISLKLAEVNGERKKQDLEKRCKQIDSLLAMSEKSLAEKDRIIFQLRLDTKDRLDALKRTVRSYRVAQEGMVQLDKFEKLTVKLLGLEGRINESQTCVATLMKEKRELQSSLDETELRAEMSDKLLAALKDPNGVDEHLNLWHKRMSEGKLTQLRLTREVEMLQQTEETLRRQVAQQQAHISELETQLVSVESAMSVKEMEWERRETGMEQQLQGYEEEREKIYRAASSTELTTSMLDPERPLSEQLEHTVRQLAGSGKTVIEQNVRIAALETSLRTVTAQLTVAQKQIDDMEQAMKELEESAAATSETLTQRDARCSELNDVIAKHEEETSELRNIITEQEAQLIELNGIVAEHKAQSGQFIKIIAKHDADAAAALTAIAEHEAKAIESRAIIRILENDAAEAKTTKQSSHETERNLNRRGSDGSQSGSVETVQAARQMISTLQLRLNHKEKAVQKYQAMLGSVREEMSAQRKEDKNLIAQLMAKANALGDALLAEQLKQQTVIANVSTARPPPRTDSAGHAQEVEALQEAVDEKRREIASLTVQLHTMNHRIKEEEAQTAKRTAKLEEALAQNEQKMEEQKLEVARLNEEIALLNDEIAILRSQSAGKPQDLFARLEADIEHHDGREQSLGSVNSVLQDTLAAGAAANVAQASDDFPGVKSKVTTEVRRGHSAFKGEDDHMNQDASKASGEIETLQQRHKTVLRKPGAAESLTKERQMSAEQWKIGKKYQKKIETLESTIAQKSKENDNLAKQIKSLTALVGKLEGASDTARGSGAKRSGGERQDGTVDIGQNNEILKENDRLQKVISLQLNPELSRLQMRERQLAEQLDSLRAVSEGGPDRDGVNAGFEARLQTLLSKSQSLEKRLLESENSRMEARFEQEKAVAECARLSHLVQQLEETTRFSIKPSMSATSLVLASEPRCRSCKAEIKCATPVTVTDEDLKNSTPQEMKAVIESLGRVISKLREENENLQKSSTTNVKYMKAVKEISALKKEREALRAAAAKSVAKNPSKPDSDAASLRAAVKRESEKAARLGRELQDVRASRDRLKVEVEAIRNHARAVEEASRGIEPEAGAVAALKKEVGEKDRIIAELSIPSNSEAELIGENRRLEKQVEMWKARVAKMTDKMSGLADSHENDCTALKSEQEAATAENKKLSAMIDELGRANDKLTAENKELRDELEAFDPQFFEELEDLKYNYKEAVQLVVKYEEQLGITKVFR